jgi:hypothetical protein
MMRVEARESRWLLRRIGGPDVRGCSDMMYMCCRVRGMLGVVLVVVKVLY